MVRHKLPSCTHTEAEHSIVQDNFIRDEQTQGRYLEFPMHHLVQQGKLTLKETLAAESVFVSLKPDRNSDTELPTVCEAIFDISTATEVLESDDVAEL